MKKGTVRSMTASETSIFDAFFDMIPDDCKPISPLSYHEYAIKQCEWYNEISGNLNVSDGYNCEECKNRGYFQILDEEDNHLMRPCKCQRVRTFIRTMQVSGLGDLYRRCTFDRYKVENDWQRQCKESALAYAKDSSNGWFYFAGQSGCGKTHLCTAICSYLARHGRTIMYVVWKSVFDKLVQTKFKDADHEQILNAVINADVLYIDDFLKTPKNAEPAADMLSYALEIIDARYKADRKTIFSTEFMIDDIFRFDDALGGRIAEKTKKNKIQVSRGEGKNYRRKE